MNSRLICSSIVHTLSSIWLALVFEDEYLTGNATTADQRRNDGSIMLNTQACFFLFHVPERLQLSPWHLWRPEGSDRMFLSSTSE